MSSSDLRISDTFMGAQPEWLRTGRIPSLDGLRAISIIAVTISHLIPASGSPFPHSWHAMDALGAPGVDVFFVISGFLITHLLILERAKYGNNSLSRFYLRRSLRILPAYFLFLGIVFLSTRLGWTRVSADAWLPSLTYTYNLVPGMYERVIGQIWSLCVEEHFYLMWPLTLVIVGYRWAPGVLGGVLVAAPALRFLLWGTGIDLDLFTFTRIDTIAFGCLMAVVVHDPRSWRSLERLQGRGDVLMLGSLAILILSITGLSRSGDYILGPKRFVEAAAIGVLILAAVGDSTSRIRRVLNSATATRIGVLSYSLYLGQFILTADTSAGWPLSWWWDIPLLTLYALASYHFVEHPILRLKDRLEQRRFAAQSLQSPIVAPGEHAAV